MALCVISLVSCKREERKFNENLPGAEGKFVRLSPLQPGPVTVGEHAENKYDDNAYAQSEGKRLYSNMNCKGCHAEGGGSMGPPLMDDDWIYGSEPQQIFATIVEGRPNGMPSFQGKLTNQQVWQLVAYVRSLSGLTRRDARNGRNDHMATTTPEQARNRQVPVLSVPPGNSDR